MALRTITLAPGECATLPSTATVQSVILDGAITATSDCSTLPAPTAYKCGYFYLQVDVDASDLHSMDEEHTYYTSVTVNNTTFEIGELVIHSGSNPGSLTLATTLNTHISNQALFKFTDVQRLVLSKRQRIYVYFRVPESLFNSTTLKVDNYGSYQIFEPLEGVCGETPVPE